MNKTEKILWWALVFMLFLCGLTLRHYTLKGEPVWIDEAKFYNELISGNNWEYREIIPVIMVKSVNNKDLLRIPFVFVSAFSIIAVFLVIKDDKKALIIASMIAFTPIFYYWGGMARPYAFALTFTVLGWRWKWFYIPAVLTTPYALAGLNLWEIKSRWIYYVIIAAAGVFYYYSMSLSRLDHFNMEYFLNAKRLWIIPLANLMFHCAEFDMERLRGLFKNTE